MLSRVFRVLSQRVQPAAALMRSARMFGGHSSAPGHHAAPVAAMKAAPAELNTEEVGEEPNGALGQFEIDEATRTQRWWFFVFGASAFESLRALLCGQSFDPHGFSPPVFAFSCSFALFS